MPPRTFPLSVEGIGDFTFRERTMLEHIQIEQEVRNQSVNIMDVDLLVAIEAVVVLPRIMVAGPEDFDLAALDPLDPDDWKKLGAIYGGLRAAEANFRKSHKAKREGVGRRDGGDVRVPVPAPLQPAAE